MIDSEELGGFADGWMDRQNDGCSEIGDCRVAFETENVNWGIHK